MTDEQKNHNCYLLRLLKIRRRHLSSSSRWCGRVPPDKLMPSLRTFLAYYDHLLSTQLEMNPMFARSLKPGVRPICTPFSTAVRACHPCSVSLTSYLG